MKKLNEQLERMRVLMNESKFIDESEEEFKESNVRSVLQVLKGLTPRIRTIGFITAQNPMGKEASAEFNKAANLKLSKILRDGQYGYRPVKGKYGGNPEDTFMVHNISKSFLLELCKNFNQESIIFAEKTEDGMRFEMVLYTGEVIGIRQVFIDRDNADDFYSKYKGKKFQIPFFNIDAGDDTELDYADAKYDDGGRRMVGVNKVKTKIDGKEYDADADKINEIERLQEEALTQTGHSAYVKRGLIKSLLKKIING